jgi:hypothetical protein
MLLAGVALASACGREDAYVGTPQTASWEFMQSVGGISIGQAQKRDDSTWVLPVACDVSGLQTITHKPTVMHSGVVVTRVLQRISGRDIGISVVVNTPLGAARSSECPPITLSAVSPGRYQVLYLEPDKTPHALGTVTLE